MFRDVAHQLVGCLELLCGDVELVAVGVVGGLQRCDLAADGAHVLRGFGDVTGAGLALGADHRGALVDAAQRLAEVGGAADEGNVEGALVHVVGVIGGAEHLGLVDVVDAQVLEDARLHGVADAGLRHHRDVYGVQDALDEVGVGHASNAALGADVRGNALERHDGHGTGRFGDLRLLRRDDVHDHAALERVGEFCKLGEICHSAPLSVHNW